MNMQMTLKNAVSGCSLRLLAVAAVFAPAFALAQQRPPAVPLIAHNPYFSVWSMADRLTDEDTKHWTGAAQPITGLARIDGQTYRFMGAMPRSTPAMQQTSLEVTPTRTIYTFQAAQVTLTVTFFTPAFPKDLDLLSRPVTYLTLAATGEGAHDITLLIDADPLIAVNTRDEEVTWGRSRIPGLTVLNAGSREQRVLNRPGRRASCRRLGCNAEFFRHGNAAGERRSRHAADAARSCRAFGRRVSPGQGFCNARDAARAAGLHRGVRN
jgi:hypothetical protein